MKHTISLDFDELNVSFIENLKLFFKNSKSRLTIVIEEEDDETAYLLKSELNKEILMKSLENARNGNVIVPDLEQFRKLTNA